MPSAKSAASSVAADFTDGIPFRSVYLLKTKNSISRFLKIKPNTPNPKTKNSIIMPNRPAFDSLPKFQTMKPKKIIKTDRQIFNAQSANTASSILSVPPACYRMYNTYLQTALCQSPLQISNQIISIFQTDRQTHQARADIGRQLVFGRHSAVRSRPRMGNR